MSYCVLIPNRVAAMNVDALNRSVIAGSGVDYQNGSVFRLDSKSSASPTEAECWTPSAGTSNGSTLAGLWMANSPAVVLTVSGTSKYRGIDPNPMNYTNVGGYAFDAIKLQEGDIVTMTADGFVGSQNTYANATSGSTILTWGAAQTANALSLKYLKTTYISIGDGSIGNQRQTAYELVVLNN